MRQQLLVGGNKRVTCVIYLIEKSFTSCTVGICLAKFHIAYLMHPVITIRGGDLVFEKWTFTYRTDFRRCKHKKGFHDGNVTVIPN